MAILLCVHSQQQQAATAGSVEDDGHDDVFSFQVDVPLDPLAFHRAKVARRTTADADTEDGKKPLFYFRLHRLELPVNLPPEVLVLSAAIQLHCEQLQSTTIVDGRQHPLLTLPLTRFTHLSPADGGGCIYRDDEGHTRAPLHPRSLPLRHLSITLTDDQGKSLDPLGIMAPRLPNERLRLVAYLEPADGRQEIPAHFTSRVAYTPPYAEDAAAADDDNEAGHDDDMDGRNTWTSFRQTLPANVLRTQLQEGLWQVAFRSLAYPKHFDLRPDWFTFKVVDLTPRKRPWDNGPPVVATQFPQGLFLPRIDILGILRTLQKPLGHEGRHFQPRFQLRKAPHADIGGSPAATNVPQLMVSFPLADVHKRERMLEVSAPNEAFRVRLWFGPALGYALSLSDPGAFAPADFIVRTRSAVVLDPRGPGLLHRPVLPMPRQEPLYLTSNLVYPNPIDGDLRPVLHVLNGPDWTHWTRENPRDEPETETTTALTFLDVRTPFPETLEFHLQPRDPPTPPPLAETSSTPLNLTTGPAVHPGYSKIHPLSDFTAMKGCYTALDLVFRKKPASVVLDDPADQRLPHAI